jgi:hypothetical protein
LATPIQAITKSGVGAIPDEGESLDQEFGGETIQPSPAPVADAIKLESGLPADWV